MLGRNARGADGVDWCSIVSEDDWSVGLRTHEEWSECILRKVVLTHRHWIDDRVDRRMFTDIADLPPRGATVHALDEIDFLMG